MCFLGNCQYYFLECSLLYSQVVDLALLAAHWAVVRIFALALCVRVQWSRCQINFAWVEATAKRSFVLSRHRENPFFHV